MNDFEFIAQMRSEKGTGAMRRMRRTGKVPAVLFGAGKDSMMLMLETKDVTKKLENEAIASHILTVKVNGSDEQAVLKNLQRDPTNSKVLHLDLQRVSATEKLTINVPLHFINEEQCPGQRAGGVVSHLMIDVEISCLPKDLPEFIEVDIGEMELDASIHLSEIVVPEGVELTAFLHGDDDAAHDQTVVSVALPRIVEEEEEIEGELEEGAEVPTTGEAPAEDDGGDAKSD